VVSKWEGSLDVQKARQVLAAPPVPLEIESTTAQ
jgi:hypothetical protein